MRSFEVKGSSTQKLCCPRGVCVGPDGLLYVMCDPPVGYSSLSLWLYAPRCVLVFMLCGEYVGGVRGVGDGPGGVAVDADGFVYVTYYSSNNILVY